MISYYKPTIIIVVLKKIYGQDAHASVIVNETTKSYRLWLLLIHKLTSLDLQE